MHPSLTKREGNPVHEAPVSGWSSLVLQLSATIHWLPWAPRTRLFCRFALPLLTAATVPLPADHCPPTVTRLVRAQQQ